MLDIKVIHKELKRLGYKKNGTGLASRWYENSKGELVLEYSRWGWDEHYSFYGLKTVYPFYENYRLDLVEVSKDRIVIRTHVEDIVIKRA